MKDYSRNCTNHFIDRASERLDMNQSQAIRLGVLAAERGKSADELPKREREYMTGKESRSDRRILYYNGSIFVFSAEGVCITVFEAPSWFGRKQHYNAKERIRDAKKYCRYMLPDAA